jgi:hypothetical protein
MNHANIAAQLRVPLKEPTRAREEKFDEVFDQVQQSKINSNATRASRQRGQCNAPPTPLSKSITIKYKYSTNLKHVKGLRNTAIPLNTSFLQQDIISVSAEASRS